MTNLINGALLWGPSIYYALGAVNNLISPSLVKAMCGASRQAKEAFPAVFKNETNLRQDIAIYRVSNLRNAAALGTNFGPSAVLLVSKELSLVDHQALNYICKHEISHIQTNDALITGTLASVVSALSSFAVPFLKSCLPWWAASIANLAPLLLGRQIYSSALTVFEDKADRFATFHATTEELRGIERYISGEIEVNQALQTRYPKLFSADGNTRSSLGDDPHSPLTVRLDEIRKELRSRGLDTTQDVPSVNSDQMKKIRKLHENFYRQTMNLKIS